ncbi:protein rolling protein [Trifolium repens]|nr:protein rolling protein [Trifolium repens]
MALVVEWYDFVCFAIVGGSILVALWLLWTNEGSSASHSDFDILVDSLLVASPSQDNRVAIGHVNNSQLWTSCWRGVHPLVLFATRFSSLVILAVLLSLDIHEYDASIFYYYTEWTFTLVMIYFALGTTVSAYGCWKLFNKPPPLQNGEMAEFLRRDLDTKTSIRLQTRYVEEEFKQIAGFLGYLMQITYQTSAGAVILTDIVFWCVIVPFLSISHFKLNMLMGCMHTLNAFFLLFDTLLNNLSFPWFRIAYFVLWSCSYVIFQWVIHACGFKWWPYPFLELNIPYAPLWYICMALVHIPCYGLYSLIVKAKINILPRFFPRAFLRSY